MLIVHDTVGILHDLLARPPRGRPEPGAVRGLRVRALRSLTEVAPLAPQLDALALASRRPSPFDTFAYLETFVAHDEHEEPGRRILFLVAFEGESPVGFLPLRESPERMFGIPYVAIRCLVSHDNDRPRVIARPADEERCAEVFYRHLLEVERGWDLLALNEQDAESSLLRPPASLDLRRHDVRRFPNNANATLFLGGRTVSEYLRDLHASHPKRRRAFERRVRKLFAGAQVEFVKSGDEASLRALFELYLDLERRSWKAKVNGHIGRHPRRVAFFRRLLDGDQPMKMTVGLLLRDGVPVAGWVAGRFAGTLYFLEEAFDEAFRDLAPGNAMMLLQVREAVLQGCSALDMLGNYSYYKEQWLATITETQAVQIRRKGSLVHLKALAGDLLRRLRPPVTQRDVGFNLDRRGSEAGGDAKGAELPERREERDRAQAVLQSLEAAGARVERLEGEALRRVMTDEAKAASERRAPEAT